MSRCILNNEVTGDAIVVGWDPGLQTYFAQVFVVGKKDPCVWLGCQLKEYSEPNAVIEAVRPYACYFDTAKLENNLREDKHLNSDRVYAL